MRRRIAVTGMGVVCSAGLDVPSFAGAVRSGVSCLQEINNPQVSHYRARHAGQALTFDAPRFAALLPHNAHPDRYVLLAIAAVCEALESAGVTDCSLTAMGLFFATCSGPMLSIENHYRALLRAGISSVDYFNTRYYSGARVLAHLLNINGPNTTITTACSASINAIGTACDQIHDGTIRIALAGGADSFSLTTLAGFDGLKATCPQQCAPFSKPYGMNLGEGSGFVVLEDFEHAVMRGAPILAEILGYGTSNDAYHETSPDPAGRGPASAMIRGLTHAGLPPSAITYVNVHGTGTEANDKAETRSLRKVFGEHADTLAVSSTKSITGHCLGAAGVIELIASISCSRAQVLPCTANYKEPREGCTLDYVGTAGRVWNNPGPFMKNNLAFGGNNATIIATTNPNTSTDLPDPTNNEPLCITGIGVVSPAGIGMSALHTAVYGDRQHVPVLTVGEIDPKAVDRRLDLRSVSDATRFAVIAAAQAITGAGFGARPSERANIGFYYHCAHGPAWAEGDHIQSLFRESYRISQLTAFPHIVPNSVTGTLCRLLSLTGHNSTFCSGDGAGLCGLPFAASAIRNGHVSIMLTGSSDELSANDHVYARLNGTEQTAAEGSVMLILESKASAIQRGVPILATLLGVVSSQDVSCLAGHDTDRDVLEKTIHNALKSAMIDVSQVSLVCAPVHGRVREAVGGIFADAAVEFVDVAKSVGVAESTYPLLNLVCALEKSNLDQIRSETYILAVYSSQNGQNTAAVIKAGS